jgi:hypothetical protein
MGHPSRPTFGPFGALGRFQDAGLTSTCCCEAPHLRVASEAFTLLLNLSIRRGSRGLAGPVPSFEVDRAPGTRGEGALPSCPAAGRDWLPTAGEKGRGEEDEFTRTHSTQYEGEDLATYTPHPYDLHPAPF